MRSRRSAAGSWPSPIPRCAGRSWPTPSARWAGGPSRTGRRLRSAATRWRSRAIARSPTRSPSSFASAHPTWSWRPAGLGDGLQGIWRGFRELVAWGLLDRIPRMVAVEVGGAVASALASGKDWVAPTGYVETPARSLAGVTGTVQTLHAVVESEGLVVRVSDAELEHARMQMGELEGTWIDLAAAAPIAAVDQARPARRRPRPDGRRRRRHRARRPRRVVGCRRDARDRGRARRRSPARAGGQG